MENQAMTKPLAERLDRLLAEVANVLPDAGADSGTLHEHLEAAEALRPEIETAATLDRAGLLDPATTREDIEAARRQAENAALDLERLDNAISQLGERFIEARAAEREAEKKAAYDTAEALRDVVAKRIKREYPALQSGLIALCEAILQANLAVDRVNEDLPAGAEPLHRPEGQVRGFHDRGSYDLPVSTSTFRIIQAQLPDLAATDRATWPPVLSWENHARRPGKTFTIQEVMSHWRRKR